jgi:protein required for attachment to host cells
MKTEWILLANAAIARLFRRDSPGEPLIPLETLEHPQSRLKGSQLTRDRAGHEATDHSSGGNRYEPRDDARGKEHRHFARELAERLNAGLANREYGVLRIFASNPFLGELKAQLSPAVARQLHAAVDLDMTSLGLAEIEDRLRQLHPERSGL